MSTSRESEAPRRSSDRVAGNRSQARERALALLYEAEARPADPRDVLAGLPLPADSFAVALVTGVATHAEEIDQVVSAHATGWTLDRMPVLDRGVLRIATYELLYCLDVPLAVVIDEAVELAKVYSTEDSWRYVNGVLSAVAAAVRPGSASVAPGGTE